MSELSEHIERSKLCDYDIQISGRKFRPYKYHFVEMSLGADSFYKDKGIYLLTDKGEVVYVGVTLTSYRKRLTTYLLNSEFNRNRRVQCKPMEFDGFVFFPKGKSKITDIRMLIMELELIELFKPKYNIIGNDVKHSNIVA